MKNIFVTFLWAAACSLCLSPANAQSVEHSGLDKLSQEGKQVFGRWCAACHAPGPRFPGTASLAAKYGNAKPAALEERKDLSPEIITHFVRQGVLTMPQFRKTEITDSDLDALGVYLGRQAPK